MARPKTNIQSKSISIRLTDGDLVQFNEYVESVKDQNKYMVVKLGKAKVNITAIVQDLVLSGMNKNTFGSTDDLIKAQVEKRVEEEENEAVKMLNGLGLNERQINNLDSHLSFNTKIIQDVVQNIHEDQTTFTSTVINLVNKMANQVEKNNKVMDLENEIKNLIDLNTKGKLDLERSIDYSNKLNKIINDQNKTISDQNSFIHNFSKQQGK